MKLVCLAYVHSDVHVAIEMGAILSGKTVNILGRDFCTFTQRVFDYLLSNSRVEIFCFDFDCDF